MLYIHGLMLVACADGLRLHQRGLRFFCEFVQVHKLFVKRRTGSGSSTRTVRKKEASSLSTLPGFFIARLIRGFPFIIGSRLSQVRRRTPPPSQFVSSSCRLQSSMS